MESEIILTLPENGYYILFRRFMSGKTIISQLIKRPVRNKYGRMAKQNAAESNSIISDSSSMLSSS